MTDMIERVARAIHEKQYGSITSPYGDPQDQKTKWSKVLARVAIEAMREPTGEMLDASLGHMVPANKQEQFMVQETRKEDAITWQAMIDAALKTGK